MVTRHSMRALSRRCWQCAGARRGFATSSARAGSQTSTKSTNAPSRSWSTGGVLAVALATGVLGWGVAESQREDAGVLGRLPLFGASSNQRFATVREMEKVRDALRRGKRINSNSAPGY